LGGGFVFHRRVSIHRVSFPFVTLLVTAGLIVAQRVAPFDRMLLYLLPILLLWAGAGLDALWRINPWTSHVPAWAKWGTFFTILTLVGWAGVQANIQLGERTRYAMDTAQYLSETISPGAKTAVVVTFPDDALVWFALDTLDVDMETQWDGYRNVDEVFVIVNPREQNTVESTLATRDVSLTPETITSAQLRAEFFPIEVYSLTP
jgi:hypothetical protein